MSRLTSAATVLRIYIGENPQNRYFLRTMKFLFRLAGAIFLLSSASLCHAQMPGASSGFNAAMFKLFGKHDNFSVDAELQILEGTQKAGLTMTFTMAVMEGKMRADVDMANISGPLMSPEVKTQMKSLGMDKVISIMRPDKSRMLLIYPGIRSYADVPLPKEAASTNAAVSIKKTALARETIDGHPCVKSRVMMADDKGHQQEIIVWDATDMKDFPVQLKLNENGQNILVHYRTVHFVKPEAGSFEAPAGFTKYNDLRALMSRVSK